METTGNPPFTSIYLTYGRTSQREEGMHIMQKTVDLYIHCVQDHVMDPCRSGSFSCC